MAEFLYIHIPFCIKKCSYCDFLSMPFDRDLALRYTDALCRELELKKDLAGSLKTVFFGGGTPTILSENCLAEIFDQIRKDFTIVPSAEITVEANPGTLTANKLNCLLERGVNRLSLGVQSFQDSELKTLGRIHSAEEAIRSADKIHAAGIGNFSLDLMYGIPGQSIKSWKDTLQQAVSLDPNHISAYELTPEKETELSESLKSGSLVMPEEELILAMSDFTVDFLTTAGYEQYEISNYAKPGYSCIHNINYWDRGEYLAAGAGAHGFIKGWRSSNTRDIRDYISQLHLSRIPEVQCNELSFDDELKEFIFLGLRKIEGICLLHSADRNINLTEAASDMAKEGFVEITDQHIRLTRKGRHIANTVIVQLLQNLGL